MRRLDRYILTETLGPLLVGFAAYTSIMLVRFIFRSAEMIIRRGLSVTEVGKLIGYTIPNIVVLTIPMALLFGILIAIGRLASDSELTAMRASGVSLFSLYRPIMLLSLVLAAINLGLTGYVLPRANHALQLQQLEILAQTASRQVEPRVFYEDWEGFVLYVFEMRPGDKRWHGVFLAPSILRSEHDVTVAERGWLDVDEAGEKIVLVLQNAITHKVDLNHPESYQLVRHDQLEVLLQDQFTSSRRAKIAASKGVRELTFTELLEWREDPDRSIELRRLAEVEIHKKFAIPAACLVFGLFALPLGFNNRRGGKSSGFALSIAVIMAYYVMMSNGEEAARVGKMAPWLSMWLPNLVFTVLGAFLLTRRNRDKSLLLSRLDRLLRVRAWSWVNQLRRRRSERKRRRREARARSAARPDVVVRIPQLTFRFPNILDRYVIRTFSLVLLLVTLSGVALYVIADLTENLDEILRSRPPVTTLVDYYLYLSLQIFFEISPILILMATLITFSLLARTNELTAVKALGVSLFRMSIPALMVAAGVALGCAVLQAEVLPASNQKVAELKDRIRGRPAARTYRRVDRQWLFGQGRYLYNFLYYDQQAQLLKRLQVFEFDDSYQLSGRLFAEEARYTDEGWLFSRGWARSFDGAREASYRPFESPRLSDYQEDPSYFASDVRRPEQMHYRELESYIRELERSGQKVPELRVELYDKLALPAVSFVMALVALPFAFKLGRKGALYGIGFALFLGMVYLAVYAFFSTLGKTDALPPLVAVWSPSALFVVLSLYLFLGVRT